MEIFLKTALARSLVTTPQMAVGAWVEFVKDRWLPRTGEVGGAASQGPKPKFYVVVGCGRHLSMTADQLTNANYLDAEAVPVAPIERHQGGAQSGARRPIGGGSGGD